MPLHGGIQNSTGDEIAQHWNFVSRIWPDGLDWQRSLGKPQARPTAADFRAGGMHSSLDHVKKCSFSGEVLEMNDDNLQ